MSALYIVMVHTSGVTYVGNGVVPYALDSSPLCATPGTLVRSRTSRAARIRREYLFLLQPPPQRSWVNRFLVTPVRIDPDALAAPTLPEINKSGKFELSPTVLFHDLSYVLSYVEHIFLRMLWTSANSIFAFHKGYFSLSNIEDK